MHDTPPLSDSAAPLFAFVRGVAGRVLRRPDIQFILHCVLLLAMLVLVRPMFTAPVPAAAYEKATVVSELLRQDLALVITGAQRHRPEVPRLLFLVIPTAIVLLTGRRMTWSRWDHGHALRGLVMALLVALAWAGSTFDYNLYLARWHGVDRLLLVGLAALSWRTPLAVPFATAWSIVMLKEAYVPVPLDDFDFRPVAEVLIAFSCFVWASIRPSFRAKHFLLVGLGVWASYYYAAGVAKIYFGPRWSWLLDDHLANLAFATHARGWLSFIPDRHFDAFVTFARKIDVSLTFFTMVVELGALVMFYVHPKLTRAWTLMCAVLHVGIFVMSGVFFWKWIVANLAFWFFLRRGLARPLEEMCRHKLVILFAITALLFSRNRIWYFPQTGVAWYDSTFLEDYQLVAVGPSGRSYVVNPTTIAPMEMHWTQGRLCYATDERSITGIYGVTGSHGTYMALEQAKKPADALKLLSRGNKCTNPERKKVFEDFMRRYFGNMNRMGRPQRWVRWIGRPKHLWLTPRGELYDRQEPVERIEVWRELVFFHGGATHRLEKKLVHQVAIPR